MSPNPLCPTEYLTPSKLKWINAVEFIAGAYYIGVLLLGFRNIYIIFIEQKKVASIIFPLMYFFAQAICILQIAQCFMFYRLNNQVEAICYGEKQPTTDKVLHYVNMYRAAFILLPYVTAFKGCIGCVQMA